ncbi:hypothetical protein LTS18_002902 [Coniosporium uncinatum]|uniref:Uncharacterized protein n=1 Tax=Coniosporium uncinatum TaxID=93489 RepID=A0ACC3DTR1_9PEZI|nr:hypothetical protein LTS18_002902 [Coniosporium uncinatum]
MDIWADDPWAEAEPAYKPATTEPIEKPHPGWLKKGEDVESQTHENSDEVVTTSSHRAAWAFEDEAGWGEDDDFGTFESHTQEVDTLSGQDSDWNGFEGASGNIPTETDHDLDAAKYSEQRTSVAADGSLSDSGSTITPSTHDATTSTEKATVVTDVQRPTSSGREDTSSRPSTSPSPTPSNFSRTGDVVVDSPRTSFEADTVPVTDAKDHATTGLDFSVSDESESKTSLSRTAPLNEEVGDEDEFGDSPVELLSPRSRVPGHDSQEPLTDSKALQTKDEDSAILSQPGPTSSLMPSDIEIITNFEDAESLFSKTAAPNDLAEADESSLWSTSSRKAWYRVTRQQTMHQYNLGKDENDSVRVRWKRSGIQSEVNKIASRWSMEDRFLGGVSLGGRPASMFGWEDTAAPLAASSQRANVDNPRMDSSAADVSARNVPSHTSRKASSTAKAKAAPVAASPVAQFGWSSTANTKNVSPSIPERTSSKQHSRAASASPMAVQAIEQMPQQLAKPLVLPQSLTDPPALALSQPTAASAPALTSATRSSDVIEAPESLTHESPLSPEPLGDDAQPSVFTVALDAATFTTPSDTSSWLDEDISIFEGSTPAEAPDNAQVSNLEETFDNNQPELALENENRYESLKFATVAPPTRLMGPIPLGLQQPTSSDDTTKVFEILRNLPDLSYMLL